MASLQIIIKKIVFIRIKNKVIMKFIIACFFIFWSYTINAQKDSSNFLSYEYFMAMVKKNHPIAKQAALITKTADAKLLISKGNFDPKIFYDFNQKQFDEKNYWTIADGGFKVPTWFGIEIKGGYEQNNGQYLNPEELIPSQGLIYSQISFPIGQGLFIDERRAQLKQAKLLIDLSDFEKTNLINELLLNAGKVYWDWQMAYNNLIVYNNSVTIAKQRFDGVVESVKYGDRPSIDTLEASIQLQERIVNTQQAQIDYINKSLLLSNYLWMENDTPLQITNKTAPQTVSDIDQTNNYILSTVSKIDSLLSIHPQLKTYDFKAEQLKVEQKLKKEKLKPSLNVNYNPLFQQNNNENNYLNNYKWGVNFTLPIFIRKERGDLQLTKIKLQELNFEIKNKQNEIQNKIKAQLNEYNTSNNQIKTYINTVNNYRSLWIAEKTLFETGESSLFMVNSREMAYINAQVKLNELINKNKKSVLNTEFALGQLNTLY